jgi:hypothetical protein
MNKSPVKCLDDYYDLLKYFIPIIAGFDRKYRYSVGLELERTLYDILSLLVDAAFKRDQRETLGIANSRLEYARYLVRLCHDLNQISAKQYGNVAKSIELVGSQIGGWVRFTEKAMMDSK